MYNDITPAYKSADAIALEMYKNSLDPMTIVFLRRDIGANTLSLDYSEAVNIDRKLNP